MSALGGRKKLVSASRSGRVLARLEQAMKLEKYYEAHQTIRVLYQRYLAQNRDKDALDILYTGARFLLEHQQVTLYCGKWINSRSAVFNT